MGIERATGKKFYASHIKAIKGNRSMYEGKYRYGKMDWVEGVHEAIFRGRKFNGKQQNADLGLRRIGHKDNGGRKQRGMVGVDVCRLN